MKRFLAVFLCLCMILPATLAFAASEASKQTYSTESLKGEIIIENPVLTGDDWKDSVLNYAHKWATGSGKMATYIVEGIKAGNYEAYFWLIPHKNDAMTIDIYVDHNGKTSKSSLYQKLEDGETVEAGWVSFGVFDFAASGDQKIYTPSVSGNIRATKMRLVPTTKKVTGTGDAKYEGTVPSVPAGSGTTANNEVLDGEIIYHYKDAQCNGNWADSQGLKNYDGGSQAWNMTENDTIVYTATGIKEGNYEIFLYYIKHEGNVEKTPFTVVHNGKTSKIFALTNPNKGGAAADGWVSMGVLDFKGTGDETLTLVHPGGGHARGSAIKLVPTDKEVSASGEETADVVSGVPAAVYVSGKPEKVSVPHGDSQLEKIAVEPLGICTWEGNWAFSGAVPGPMTVATNSMWVAASDANGGKATVTYNPDIMAVGDVNIFVYLLWWKENQNNKVEYEVHHNGKIDKIVLDPTALTESTWVNLGTFDFAGKSEEEFVKLVAVDSETTKANTRASTVMFEIVNTEGGIWQTRYVTPVYDADAEIQAKLKTLTPLDKFTDMVGHWANYDVEYMANEGLISGVAENLFNPEAQITRAEYLTILDRAMGYEIQNGESYPDVAQDQWYAPYVATAKKNGLIEGLPTDDGFKPTQPITREEMALFAYNAIKATKKNDAWVATMPDGWANFTDTAEVSPWAQEALKYLIQTEIIKGMTNTTVVPKGNATRAQGAVILKRFMQLFVWAGPPVNQDWTLMFNDEFLGTEANWGVWRSDASSPGHIQSSRWPENVEVHDGAVHLVIRKEEKGGKQWTAGSIWVRPEVFAQTYGYWEARYKIAAAPGINNSFWTYVPHAFNIHMDPDVTTHYELDINEGHYPNEMATNYHTWVSGERKQYSKAIKFEYDLSKDYHTYALEWTPEKLIYYFDGEVVREQENLNAHQLQFPYLSSAVLNWAGQISDEADGTAQIVDYVRIWQKTENANDPKLNYKGEPMVGVAPEAAGPKEPVVDEEGVEIPEVTVKDQQVDNTEYPGEIIIPTEVEGTWNKSKAIKNYNDGEHLWSNVQGAVSKYPLKDVAKGEYKVYIWRLPHQFNIAQMNIRLKQDGKDGYFGSVALKDTDGGAEPGWIEIGTLTATGDKDAYFHYTCEGINCRATAVKLVLVK